MNGTHFFLTVVIPQHKIRHTLRLCWLIQGIPYIMMNLLDENLSDSMEMYLVTIAKLRKDEEPVPLSKLAESLDVTSVSVNEMCRKLQDYGFVTYRPYKGAALTNAGEKLANHTLSGTVFGRFSWLKGFIWISSRQMMQPAFWSMRPLMR